MSSASSRDPTIIIALVATGCIWGVTFLLLAKGLHYFPPVVLQAVRYLIGFLCAFACILLKSFTDPTFRAYCKSLVTGGRFIHTIKEMAIVSCLFQGIGAYSCVLGETHVSSGIVSILFCLEPIFAALFLLAVGKLEDNYFDPEMIQGIVLSISGVSLVLLPELAKTDPEELLEQVVFIIISIIAVGAFGVGAGVSKVFSDTNKTHPLVLIAGQFFFGLVILSSVHILEDLFLEQKPVHLAFSFEELRNVPWEGWAIVTVLGTISTTLCWGLFMWLVSKIGAKASVYTFLVPCVSLLAGAVFNSEWNGVPFQYILMELVGVGVVLAGMKLILRKEIEGGPSNSSEGKPKKLVELSEFDPEEVDLLMKERQVHSMLIETRN